MHEPLAGEIILHFSNLSEARAMHHARLDFLGHVKNLCNVYNSINC